jgi:hypothetical protein
MSEFVGNWYILDEFPAGCMFCDEELNGLWFHEVKIRGLKTTINCCRYCKEKLWARMGSPADTLR